ncbi:MAG: T9SS type A sorting domain-containing protein [Bacteroidota bacterium]
MKQFYFLLAYGSLFTSLCAQGGIIGSGFGSGFSNPADIIPMTPSLGNSQIYITTANGTGNQFFRFVNTFSNEEYGPFGCTDTNWSGGAEFSYDNMPICTNGAFFINAPNTTDTYIFKTPGLTENDFIYFRFSAPPPNIFEIVHTDQNFNDNPTEVACDATVSIGMILDGPLPAEGAVYLRYSLDNFATSTVVEVPADIGGLYLYNLAPPANNDGKTLSYYAFISGKGNNAAPQSNGSDADYRTINVLNNGGNNYSFQYNCALPVRFSAWSGQRQGKDVTLQWVTAEEQNADYFDLQSSKDQGRSWQSIANIPAANRPSEYAYLHRNVPAGDLQYRLQQFDFDGSYQYSNILSIAGQTKPATVLDVWPTPVSQLLNITLAQADQESSQISLHSTTGQEWLRSNLRGYQSISLDVTDFPRGVYFLRLVSADGTISMRKILIH